MVSSRTPAVTYVWDGSTTAFSALPFPVSDEETVAVILASSDGETRTVLAYATDYTVTSSASSSTDYVDSATTVTIASPSSWGTDTYATITFMRASEVTQEQSFTNGRYLNVKTVEAILDRYCLVMQELDMRGKKAVTAPPEEWEDAGEDGSAIYLPPASERAGKLLAFGSDDPNRLVAEDPEDLEAMQEILESVQSSASLAEGYAETAAESAESASSSASLAATYASGMSSSVTGVASSADSAAIAASKAKSYMEEAEEAAESAGESSESAIKSADIAASYALSASSSAAAAAASEDSVAANAAAAALSEQNAAASEANAKASEEASALSEANAADSATLSESWAIGGTGTRDGEDEDNSKYYAGQSASAASAAATSEANAADSAEAAKEVLERISAVYTYKGSVDTYADLLALDTSDLSVGDTYNVVNDESTNTTGMNYSWTGTEWDSLGSTIDMTLYSTTEEMESYVEGLGYATDSDLSSLETRVTTAEGDIDSLETTVSGIHSTSITAGSKGSTTAVPVITYDSQGHLTAVSTATIYPPTTAGTSGNVWVSDGSGQGAWSSRLTTAESDIDSLESSVAGKQDTLGTFTASGTVGSSTAVPVLGYDTDGHITSVSTASIHSTSLTAGSKGSTTAVPVITYDSHGHLTAVSTATIYPPTTAGTSGNVWVSDGSGQGAWSSRLTTAESDIDSLESSKQNTLTAGTGLSLSSNTVSLAASGVTAGTYGSTTAIPSITVDTYGRVTSVSTKTVYPPTTAGTSGYVWTSDGSGQGVWADIIQSLGISSSDPVNDFLWSQGGYVTTGIVGNHYINGYLGEELQFEVIWMGCTSSSGGASTRTYTFARSFGARPFVFGTYFNSLGSSNQVYYSYVEAVETTYFTMRCYTDNALFALAIGLRPDSSLL